MIRTHDFNSSWLGRRFGVSEDPRLLTMSAEEIHEAAEGFDVVELRCDATIVPTGDLLPRNGLTQVDTQLAYRLPLVGSWKRSEDTTVESFAGSSPADIDALALEGFESERYLRLSGVDQPLLQTRYLTWAWSLVTAEPEWCLRVHHRDAPAGYSFGRLVAEGHLNLDVVAAAPGSTLPGLGVFKAALVDYRERGVRKVTASFSVHNLPAINVHVALGCRIISSTDIWFWQPFQM